jgi:glycosyltransferase involved in cell wall biosynthesis
MKSDPRAQRTMTAKSDETPKTDTYVVATRPARTDTLVSVVLPVFNEVKALRTLLARVQQALDKLELRREVIFVNDGSTDGSARVLDQMAARFPEVRVIHLSRNFGHQSAVQAGLRLASGNAVVLMDSDLQDAPEAIGRLIDAWQKGFDVVYALREKRKEQAWKRLLFATFHRTLAAVSTTPIPADAGNFSLIDARVVREIVALSERDRYLPGLRSWVGFRQTGVVVERLARYDDRPRVSLRGLWRLAKTAIFSFSSLPLTIFYLIGYSALAIFLGLSGYALYCRLFTDLAIPGWTSYILSASFFGALNALGISMLGEYVLRIYDQVRGRPLYLIDRTVNVAATAANQTRAATPLTSPNDFVAQDATDAVEELLAQTADLLGLSADAMARPVKSQECTPAG